MILENHISIKGTERFKLWEFGEGDLLRNCIKISDNINDVNIVMTEMAFEELLLAMCHYARANKPDYLERLLAAQGGPK